VGGGAVRRGGGRRGICDGDYEGVELGEGEGNGVEKSGGRNQSDSLQQ